MKSGRFFIMRHGETVYNASARLQSNHIHTPLTRQGFEQALAMGKALREELGARPPVVLHISETGRALQTAAIIAGRTRSRKSTWDRGANAATPMWKRRKGR
jgi:probable phosphoglycerate mutase